MMPEKQMDQKPVGAGLFLQCLQKMNVLRLTWEDGVWEKALLA